MVVGPRSFAIEIKQSLSLPHLYFDSANKNIYVT